MRRRNLAVVKTLTYAMFAMFAMTTDSVGIIIPEIVRTFRLSLTAAGTFPVRDDGAALRWPRLLSGHARRSPGTAPDDYHRPHALRGRVCFFLPPARASCSSSSCMGLSGLAIGVFKTGALALIGDHLQRRRPNTRRS